MRTHTQIYHTLTKRLQHTNKLHKTRELKTLYTIVDLASETTAQSYYLLLGVIFQSNLKMDSHVHYIISQCTQRM